MSASAALLLACLLAHADDPTRPPTPPPAGALPRASLDGPPDGPNAFSVAARFAHRFDHEGTISSTPSAGFSVGATFERRYARLGGLIDLGAALNMFYDRFSTAGDLVNPQPRAVQETSFVAMETASVPILAQARLWVGIGAGLGVGDLAATTLHALARAAGGVEIALRGRASVAVLADYTHTLASQPRGDLVDVGAALLYRF
jgi:hypothetical protein